MSSPWPTRVSPFKDKYGIEECICGEWRFLFRLIDGGWGAMPGKRIIRFDTLEEAEAYRLKYVEKISQHKENSEISGINIFDAALFLMGLTMFACLCLLFWVIWKLIENPMF